MCPSNCSYYSNTHGWPKDTLLALHSIAGSSSTWCHIKFASMCSQLWGHPKKWLWPKKHPAITSRVSTKPTELYLKKSVDGPMILSRCSFSLQAALGLLFIWTKYVESTPASQDTAISTGGFLDDNNMRCVATSAEAAVQNLEKAWLRLQQFVLVFKSIFRKLHVLATQNLAEIFCNQRFVRMSHH